MDHNYIDIENDAAIKNTVINQKDNNLDKLDNLNELPEAAAVYLICGRVNGKPANPRYVGQTENLRKEIKDHFDLKVDVTNECVKTFVQSIKIKELVYQLLPEASEEERTEMKTDWEQRFQPDCNEVLNEVH